jgi:aryl-alcohol dehydrogenase-like predicted oxidoreductase
VVCVQNAYNVLDRSQEAMLDACVVEGIAWVPFFPLGSAFPDAPKVADNAEICAVAAELGLSTAQVGLAWLLAHAPNTLLIAGTRSAAHLKDNVAVGGITLPVEAISRLDAIADCATHAP